MPSQSDDRAELPAQGIRTAASLLLFIHIFAISLALVANSTMTPSPLLFNIRQALLGHLYWTWTDVGFGYRFTGTELDMPHSVDAVVSYSDGSSEAVPIEPEGASGIRHDRYVNLATKFAAMLQNAERESLLPSMLGGGLLRQLQTSDPELVTTDAIVRCRAHPPLDLVRYQAGIKDPPPPELLYRARVRLIGNEGRVVEKFESRGQVAPNQTRAANPARTNQSRPAGEPTVLPRPLRDPLRPFGSP